MKTHQKGALFGGVGQVQERRLQRAVVAGGDLNFGHRHGKSSDGEVCRPPADHAAGVLLYTTISHRNLSSETEKIFGKSGEKREKRNENLLQFCGNCGIMSGKWGRQRGSRI
jgi:hypothetical protein